MGALFWFVLVIAVNVVTWQAFWREVILEPNAELAVIDDDVMPGHMVLHWPDGRRIVKKMPPALIETGNNDQETDSIP